MRITIHWKLFEDHRKEVQMRKTTRLSFVLFVFFLMFFWMSPSAAQEAQYRKVKDGTKTVYLNDLTKTPGTVATTDTKIICEKGYTSKPGVRNVPAAKKKQVYKEYGATAKKGKCCEVDHLISLELGGSNDISNLWPQPYTPAPGAHEKDWLENKLHALVCANTMKIEDAQKIIATDWYSEYKKLKK
jgi:hypothetical protein